MDTWAGINTHSNGYFLPIATPPHPPNIFHPRKTKLPELPGLRGRLRPNHQEKVLWISLKHALAEADGARGKSAKYQVNQAISERFWRDRLSLPCCSGRQFRAYGNGEHADWRKSHQNAGILGSLGRPENQTSHEGLTMSGNQVVAEGC